MQLELISNSLQIRLEWYERLWAFHLSETIAIPLTHIQQATTTEPQSNWKELRAPGTFLPGVIKAGTYYTDHGREFWYVIEAKNYLTLELEKEYYKRIILTLPDSDYWATQLNQHCLA